VQAFLFPLLPQTCRGRAGRKFLFFPCLLFQLAYGARTALFFAAQDRRKRCPLPPPPFPFSGAGKPCRFCLGEEDFLFPRPFSPAGRGLPSPPPFPFFFFLEIPYGEGTFSPFLLVPAARANTPCFLHRETIYIIFFFPPPFPLFLSLFEVLPSPLLSGIPITIKDGFFSPLSFPYGDIHELPLPTPYCAGPPHLLLFLPS